MKCPKHKKHEMTLKLGEPGGDVGWICNKCKSGIWPLTKSEYDIWKNGYEYAKYEFKRQIDNADKFEKIKVLLGINEFDNSY